MRRYGCWLKTCIVSCYTSCCSFTNHDQSASLFSCLHTPPILIWLNKHFLPSRHTFATTTQTFQWLSLLMHVRTSLLTRWKDISGHQAILYSVKGLGCVVNTCCLYYPVILCFFVKHMFVKQFLQRLSDIYKISDKGANCRDYWMDPCPHKPYSPLGQEARSCVLWIDTTDHSPLVHHHHH